MKKRVQYYIILLIVFPLSVLLAILSGFLVSENFFYALIPVIFINTVLLKSVKCPRCGYTLNKKRGILGFIDYKFIIDDECENCGYSFYMEGKE